MSRATCSEPGCERPHHGRGLCCTCYHRYAEQGIPFPRPPRSAAKPKKPTAGPTLERYRRFLELNRQGLHAAVIAEKMGTTARTIVRYRAVLVAYPEPEAPEPDTPEARKRRQQLAERTLTSALNAAVLIRDDGADACRAFLAGLPADERAALPHILAALVPVGTPVDRLLSWMPGPGGGGPDLVERQRQRLAERALKTALAFAALVRDQDAAGCRDFLAGLPADERAALPYLLAALVPVDEPVTALLDWITWDEDGFQTRPRPDPGPVLCAVHRVPASPAAAKRHRHLKEPVCAPCRKAERAYRRALRQSRRAA
ncbi:hypothetical protein [Planomonospora algeriensis]